MPLNRLLFILGILTIVIILIIVFLTKGTKNTENISEQLVQNLNVTKTIEDYNFFPESNNHGIPITIKIPSINVDASIGRVGIDQDGAMDSPKERDIAGWFDIGPRPGENGSAVMAGHFGWKNNLPAIFDNLHKLNKGDKIHIEDDKGNITTFIVKNLKTYNEDSYAPEVFESTDGGAHLNLITCQGVWNKNKKSYSNRLVVFADKE